MAITVNQNVSSSPEGFINALPEVSGAFFRFEAGSVLQGLLKGRFPKPGNRPGFIYQVRATKPCFCAVRVSDGTSTTPKAPPRISPPRLGAGGRRMVVNLVALAALLLILSLLSDRFLSVENAANVFRQIATVVTVGCFFTILMVSGGIDLSVGGVLTLSGIVAVILVNSGVPIPLAVVVATLLGAMVGIVNGFLVAVVGLNTVIATLGTMYVTRGSGTARSARCRCSRSSCSSSLSSRLPSSGAGSSAASLCSSARTLGAPASPESRSARSSSSCSP